MWAIQYKYRGESLDLQLSIIGPVKGPQKLSWIKWYHSPVPFDIPFIHFSLQKEGFSLFIGTWLPHSWSYMLPVLHSETSGRESDEPGGGRHQPHVLPAAMPEEPLCESRHFLLLLSNLQNLQLCLAQNGTYVLFSLHTHPLGDPLRTCDFKHHLYSADTQTSFLGWNFPLNSTWHLHRDGKHLKCRHLN